jgi:glyoxylase-like metal-dependent hydrolase (beta-lactamase superfamily II)
VKIHHLNCGCLCPVGGALLPKIFPNQAVCHCLLIETSQRLILVDTGLALRDIENPRRLGALGFLVGTGRDREITAVEQIRKAGFSASDVTDLVPTHLDFDHSGGIEDFPKANVHVSNSEYQAAFSSGSFQLKQRYKTVRFSHEVKWQIYEEQKGTDWNGFACARDLNGLPPELVAVRLPGHTPGHFGVALHFNNKWMLHAGDAYYDHRELTKKPIQIGLSLFQRAVHADYAQAMKTQQKLRELKDVDIFCAHDSDEFAAFAAAE